MATVEADDRQAIRKQAKRRLIDYLRELEPDQRELLLGARDNW